MRIARGFDRDLGSRPGSAQPQVTREWLVDASDGSQLAEPAGLGFLGIGYPTILKFQAGVGWNVVATAPLTPSSHP